MTRVPNHRLRRRPATPTTPLEAVDRVTRGVDRWPPGPLTGRAWDHRGRGGWTIGWTSVRQGVHQRRPGRRTGCDRQTATAQEIRLLGLGARQ